MWCTGVQEVAAIIHACLRFQPQERPTAVQVLGLLRATSRDPPTDCPVESKAPSRTSLELEAKYRESIENSAVRLHDGRRAALQKQASIRASIDVRKVGSYALKLVDLSSCP